MMSRLFGAYGLFALTGALAAALSFLPLILLSPADQDVVVKFFEDHLREPLFAGLLGVAAFLFSLKTFIIATMHDKVYSTPEYEKDWLLKRKLDKTLQRYAPLENFATLLFFSVLVSLLSAVAQFSLGFLGFRFTVATCVATAIWSIEMIFVSLIFLQINLRQWFSFLSESST